MLNQYETNKIQYFLNDSQNELCLLFAIVSHSDSHGTLTTPLCTS